MLAKLLSGLAVCLLCWPGLIERSQSITFTQAEAPCYRLPANVRPLKYDLHLEFPSLEATFYRGQVNISVEFLSAKKASSKRAKLEELARGLEGADCEWRGAPDEIVLHADERLKIQEVQVSSEPHLALLINERQKVRQVAELQLNRAKQIFLIKLAKRPRAGTKGTISIGFKGELSAEHKTGLYLNRFKRDGREFSQLVGQLKPIEARTVFPCFDEPQFRTPIRLSLTHEQHLAAFASAEVKSVVSKPMGELEQLEGDERQLTTTEFKTTSSLPLHMLSFVLGQFDEPLEVNVAGGGQKGARKVRVLMPPGQRDAGYFALRAVRDSLDWFERYIQYELPLEKLDVVAVDQLHGLDSAVGYGLVLVSAQMLQKGALMQDPPHAGKEQLETAVTMAHALVQQWFSGLVSPAWWSGAWFTEGVAAQFALRIVADVYALRSGHFGRRATFIGHRLAEQARRYDDEAPGHRTRQPPLSNEDIRAQVRALDFHKGALVAHLMALELGMATYQAVLRGLLADHAHQSLSLLDLAREIAKVKSGYSLEEALDVVRTFHNF